jgi:hypothetical protein
VSVIDRLPPEIIALCQEEILGLGTFRNPYAPEPRPLTFDDILRVREQMGVRRVPPTFDDILRVREQMGVRRVPPTFDDVCYHVVLAPRQAMALEWGQALGDREGLVAAALAGRQGRTRAALRRRLVRARALLRHARGFDFAPIRAAEDALAALGPVPAVRW